MIKELLNSPRISIVTVCYNAVETIEETILSVINQTYHNIEYIIIDGASTDGTVDVIKKYLDKISYFISEPDNGIYDAMNKGIKMATGEWINFMNAGDEFVDRLVIERMEPHFSEVSNDVVFGNTLLEKNEKIKKLLKGKLQSDAFPELVHQSTFVRTDLMKSHLFDTRYIISADFEFLYSLFMAGKKFCHVDTIVSKYDVSGLSSNHRAVLYKEHSEIRGIKTSRFRLLFYRLEDKLPSNIIAILIKLKDFCYNIR